MVGISVQNMPRTERMGRYPQHTFFIRHRPFVIQPHFIAPVLPGESLKRLLHQSRAVTDPIANRLIGWWCEYHYFYVKLRDLDGRDDFSQMFLQLGYDLSSYNSAADATMYHYGGAIDWTSLCLKRVVEEYFRNEGEAWDAFLDSTSGLPIGQISDDKWLDSAIPDADRQSWDEDLADAGSPGGTAVLASEIDQAMRNWHVLNTQGFTKMSFEDYLKMSGVNNVAPEEPHKPEWIRSLREWTYPTNTVEPTTGVPTSACSWTIRETADKTRFFPEPGFLFGVSVVRPKVYLRNLSGSASSALNSMLAWIPGVLSNDPNTSLIQFPQAAGPAQNGSDTDGYWVDIKDLFLYGDQFLNFDPAAVADANLVDLPTAALLKRYVDSDDIDGLFAGEATNVEQDGIVSLNILSNLGPDTTPSQTAGAFLTAHQ